MDNDTTSQDRNAAKMAAAAGVIALTAAAAVKVKRTVARKIGDRKIMKTHAIELK